MTSDIPCSHAFRRFSSFLLVLRFGSCNHWQRNVKRVATDPFQRTTVVKIIPLPKFALLSFFCAFKFWYRSAHFLVSIQQQQQYQATYRVSKDGADKRKIPEVKKHERATAVRLVVNVRNFFFRQADLSVNRYLVKPFVNLIYGNPIQSVYRIVYN